jgi:hypothetical protein
MRPLLLILPHKEKQKKAFISFFKIHVEIEELNRRNFMYLFKNSSQELVSALCWHKLDKDEINPAKTLDFKWLNYCTPKYIKEHIHPYIKCLINDKKYKWENLEV